MQYERGGVDAQVIVAREQPREASERAHRNLLLPAERTAIALGLIQLALHAVFTLTSKDARILMPHLVAWIQDLGILSLVVALASFISRFGMASWSRLVAAACQMALLAMGAALAIYPRMLHAFLTFPINIFNIDISTAQLFLRDYLGLENLLPAGVAIVGGLTAPRFCFLRLPYRRAVSGSVLALTLLTSIGMAQVGMGTNPVMYSLQEKLRELLDASPRAVPMLVPGPVSGGARFEASPSPLDPDRPMRYDRVLLVVLESVTSAAFESELLHRQGGFAERNAPRARYFSNYYTMNQDSYTSLIAMTTSVHVPFRSYADPSRYDAVNSLPNAPRALKQKGYGTLFVSTYESQPFVPNRADWDRVADRGDMSTLAGFTTIGGSRMESATEDRAAIPLILSELARAPRSLVLAELVYGHSPEWRAKTGVGQLAYYDAYLTELLGGIAKAGLSERTLTIVVSDHGVRLGASDPENYRVPLLVVGEDVTPGVDDEFRCHLDLQAILAHYLMSTPLPPPRDRIATVGNTGRWIYGEISHTSDFVFIDEPTGKVLNRAGSLDPLDVHMRFQTQIDLVDSIVGQPAREESVCQ